MFWRMIRKQLPGMPVPATYAYFETGGFDMELAAFLEATELRPEAGRNRIRELVAEVNERRYRGVCLHPWHISLAANYLDPGRELVAVVGFPFGLNLTLTKADEARRAVDDGATELDVVMALGPFADGDEAAVRSDLAAVVSAAGEVPVKVIIEAGLWEPAQQELAARWAVQAGASWVKTSTGYGPPGATVEIVRRLRAAVGPKVLVKAAGGIRELALARALLEAGADSLGTSRAGALWEAEHGPKAP